MLRTCLHNPFQVCYCSDLCCPRQEPLTTCGYLNKMELNIQFLNCPRCISLWSWERGGQFPSGSLTLFTTRWQGLLHLAKCCLISHANSVYPLAHSSIVGWMEGSRPSRAVAIPSPLLQDDCGPSLLSLIICLFALLLGVGVFCLPRCYYQDLVGSERLLRTGCSCPRERCDRPQPPRHW